MLHCFVLLVQSVFFVIHFYSAVLIKLIVSFDLLCIWHFHKNYRSLIRRQITTSRKIDVFYLLTNLLFPVWCVDQILHAQTAPEPKKEVASPIQNCNRVSNMKQLNFKKYAKNKCDSATIQCKQDLFLFYRFEFIFFFLFNITVPCFTFLLLWILFLFSFAAAKYINSSVCVCVFSFPFFCALNDNNKKIMFFYVELI